MTRRLLLAVAVGLAAAGCSRNQSTDSGLLRYRLGEQGGNLALNFEGTTLVFDGVALPAGAGGNAGTLTKPTPGSRGDSTAGFSGLTVRQAWADGVNTVTVADRSFKLIDGGAKFQFGDKTYPVGGGQTLTVTKDGTVKE